MTLNREETLFHGMNMANSMGISTVFGYSSKSLNGFGSGKSGQTGNMNFAYIGCFKVLPFMENTGVWVT